jgi:hypothetical protein
LVINGSDASYTDVVLGEGVYYFDNVNISNGGRLIMYQPNGERTIVYSKNGYQTSSKYFIGPDSAIIATKFGTTSSATDFSGGTVMLIAGTNADIKLEGSDASLWATLTAPTGHVTLNSQNKLFGQVFAGSLTSGNNFSGGAGMYIPFYPDPPVISVDVAVFKASVSEPDLLPSGKPDTVIARFPLKMSHINGKDVIVYYHTENVTAVSTGTTAKGTLDFVPVPIGIGSVTIPATFDTASILIKVLGDVAVEGGSETFNVVLDSVVNGSLDLTSGNSGVGTIVDNDPLPAIKVVGVSKTEGDAGTTDFNFSVSLINTSDSKAYTGVIVNPITFKWSTVQGTLGDSTAIAGVDYQTQTNATGQIDAFDVDTVLTVKVIGDVRYELNDTFSVVIDQASFTGPIASSSLKNVLRAKGTIRNDDGRPRLAINDTGYDEGSVDSVRKLYVYLVDSATGKIKLTADQTPELPIRYQWSTSDGTAGHTLTPVLPDIVKDIDYVQGLPKYDTIPAGKLVDTILVTTKGDLRYEPPETFKITLTPLDSACKAGACLGDVTATNTIGNDDNQPIVKVMVDSSVHEGNRGERRKVVFTVQLLSQSAGNPVLKPEELPATPVSFKWKAINGTAVAKATGSSDTDFIAVSDVVKTMSKATDTLTVFLIGDNRFEKDEKFDIELYNLTNAAPFGSNDTLATGTILNDDSLPRIQILAPSTAVVEKKVGPSTASFTVRLVDAFGVPLTAADAPQENVTFTWQTLNEKLGDDTYAHSSGTGLADTDFVEILPTTIILNAGNLDTVLVDTIKGDAIHEKDEIFRVSVTPGTNASPDTKYAIDTVTIRDAGDIPSLTLAGVNATEGNNGIKLFNATAKLSAASAVKFTFKWTTNASKGNASTSGVGKDYEPVASPRSVTFDVGDTLKYLEVSVIGDTRLEDPETFWISIDTNSIDKNHVRLDTLKGKAIFEVENTILNDDGAPFIVLKKPATKFYEGTPPSKADTLRFPIEFRDSSGSLLTDSIGVDITYQWSTVDGSVSASFDSASSKDNDFVAVTNLPRKISAGRPLVDTLKVVVTPDSKFENDEFLRVALTDVVNANTSNSAKVSAVTTVSGTILNDDLKPLISVRDTFVTEPANVTSPNDSLVFTVKLSAASGVPVSVYYQTSAFTAKADLDATLAGQRDYRELLKTPLTFAPGRIDTTISVPVHGDSIYEGPETIRFVLSHGTNDSLVSDTLLNPGVIGTILDEDAAPFLRVNSVTASEGGTATFTISLVDKDGKTVISGKDVTFDWTTQEATALAGFDYVQTNGTGLKILALNPSVTVTVAIKADTVANEGVETFNLVLSNPVNATVGNAGVGSIKDLTAKPVVSIDSASASEGAGSITFRIHADRASAVAYSLTLNTAVATDKAPRLARSAGDDPNYVAVVSQAVVIRAGLTDTTISVKLLDNAVDDPDSLFFRVVLDAKAASDDTAFVFKDSVGLGAIVDNDGAPTLSINDVSVQEPKDAASAAVTANFTISLSVKSAQEVTVKWETAPGTAHDSDFVAASGTATIPAGQLTATVNPSVQIKADSLWEGPETFSVLLSSPTLATILKATGVGTILDNDTAPAVSIDDPTITEVATPDSAQISFKVRLSHVSARPVNLLWQTADDLEVPVANQATAGVDYRSVASTPVTIAAGDSVATLKVWVLSDNASELIESFKVLLAKAVTGDTDLTLADDHGVGSIKDANGRPQVTINDATLAESNADMGFVLTLSNKSSTPVKVRLHTVGVEATQGVDFVKLDTVVTIAAETLSQAFSVRIMDDLLHEATETFKVVLDGTDSVDAVTPSANVGGVGYGVGTITDNDAAPKLSIIDTTVMEPALMGQSSLAAVRISLSAASALPVTVKWGTADSSAQSLKAPFDFLDSGNVVTFAPGRTDTTISVRVFGDSLYEGTEAFKVFLKDAIGASFFDSLSVVTLSDNDSAPRLVIDSQSVREGEAASYTVRLNRESGLPVSFTWRTVASGTGHGFATTGLDYQDSTGSVLIAAGTTFAKFSVRTLADMVTGEGPETFQVRLASIAGATGDTIGLGTILDTNALPALSIDTIGPFHEKDTVVNFTVTLKGGVSAVPVTVHFTTHAGTATPGLRYVDTTGTAIIPAGATSVKIPVHLLDDSIREPAPETFTMVLDGVDSAKLVQPIGLATIIDTGDYPMVKVGSGDTVSEGSSLVFPVTVLGSTKDTVFVWWHTVEASAKAGVDFQSDSGVVTILPERNAGSFAVKSLADNVWEPTEGFKVRIDSVRGVRGLVAPSDSLALGWIVDVGGVPTVSFLSPDTTVKEDFSPSVPVRVGLSRPASVDVSVLVPRRSGTATYGDSAAIGADYFVRGLVNDTLVIKAGDTVSTFTTHVQVDSLDEYDETAAWELKPIAPITVSGKYEYSLTIQDDDSAPFVRFVRDTQWVSEGDTARVVAKLSRVSGKPIEAWYRTTGTAREGTDTDLRLGAHEVFYFKAGTDTASHLVRTVDDNIYEGTEFTVFGIDTLVNVSLDSVHRQDSLFIQDNDGKPTVKFTRTDTTVNEKVGTVTFTLTLSHPSAFPTQVEIHAKAGSATLDSVARISDAVLDTLSAYPVSFAAGDTVATFTLRILDDGRVEPVEDFFLKLVSTDAVPGDSARVAIEDNDARPLVKITDPNEGALLGQKDLVNGKVPAGWTLDGKVQPRFDTLLPEGPATIVKCFTDDWGNVGCDSVHVIVDLTPPTVVITEISKDGGKTWITVIPGTTPWVNKADILVKWISIDGKDTTRHQDPEHLKDSLNLVTRSIKDAAGNLGTGSTNVVLDTVPPDVHIQTPPNNSHFTSGGIPMVWIEQDGDKVTRHDSLLVFNEVGPHVVVVCSSPDLAGNVGCATDTIYIDPNAPSGATYVDTDNDGRIDAVVIQFPRVWTDSMPTFEISYGAPGANAQKGLTATYGTSSQVGSVKVINGDTVRVVSGTPVLDSRGQQVILPDGTPLFQSSTGTPLLDASGKQVTDANGVPLWKVTASGTAIDSSVLVVKLTTPFPYGWTSSSLTDLGIIKASITERDLEGKTTKRPLVDTFDIKDGVAPVILGSKIILTEDYTGKDTLVIQLSEAAQFGKSEGTGIFEISKDGGKTWISVDADTLSATGTLRVVLEPGEPGTPRPGVLIRIAGNVNDASGNGATSLTSPPVVVTGSPRPDLVVAKGPTNVLEVPAGHANLKLSGPITFLASQGGSGTAAYKPGEGYLPSSETQSVCPVLELCAPTTLYINRPASIEMFIYDHLGTYVARTSFFVTASDLKTIEKDKLDRARLQILWNLRDMNNRQVSTGVYLVRMLIRYTDESRIDAKMENYILRYGVKIR